MRTWSSSASTTLRIFVADPLLVFESCSEVERDASAEKLNLLVGASGRRVSSSGLKGLTLTIHIIIIIPRKSIVVFC